MNPQEEEDAKVRAELQHFAAYIAERTPYGWGFALLIFPFGAEGRMNYVANARRGDVVRAMYEFITASKEKFGEHLDDPEPADEPEARLKHRIAYLEGVLVGAAQGPKGVERLLAEIDRLLAEQEK